MDLDGFGDACDDDNDGVRDDDDECPTNNPALDVYPSTGRPVADANDDCVVDGLDIQKFVDELLK